MNPHRQILLVEDSPADAEMTLEALRANQVAHDTALVEDGALALQWLRREGPYRDRPPGHPVVILLDLKLPKMDGLEVLREIRADPALALIPVVMLTSSEEESDLYRSYQLGANGYVVKPLDFEVFADVVASLGVFWGAVNRPPPPRP